MVTNSKPCFYAWYRILYHAFLICGNIDGKEEAGAKPSFAAKIHIKRKDFIMKNNFVIFNYFNFIIVFLCKTVKLQIHKVQHQISKQQLIQYQNQRSIPATEQPKQKNKGTVSGKYDVEIVTAKTATDFQGNPAIIVTYNFTNNSNANASFLTSVSANAFQKFHTM